jgi:glycosyltransferase involved in cell wall biosynthesis
MSSFSVLHVGKYYAPYPGGIESATQQLMEFMSDAGLSAHALVHHHKILTLADEDGHEQRVLRSPIIGRLLFTPIAPLFWWDLRRMLARRPDLLHIHLPNVSAFWCLINRQARRLPWVVHWHADIVAPGAPEALRIAYRAYRPMEQALLGQARRIVVTNPRVLEASAALRPWAAKCSVVPLAVPDLDQSAPAMPDPGQQRPAPCLRLLTVARLSVFKGHLGMLHHLAQLKARAIAFHWSIVGSGDMEQEIINKIRILGLEGETTLHGTLQGAALHRAYRDCDVFILPSISALESFGIVLLEAMRAGKPCVVHDIAGSGMAYVVQHGKTGVVVPLNNSTRWVDTLADAACNASKWREYGAAGRARYLEHFTPASVRSRWLTHYRTLLEHRHGAQSA